MPIEIKELVLQAKLNEEEGLAAGADQKEEGESEVEEDDYDASDRTEEIVEACLERVKAWLEEQQLR